MSFYQLERAAQIIPHDASIQLHDGWVSFRRPGYPTVSYTTKAGSIRELAYRAAEVWQRYQDATLASEIDMMVAPAKSAHVGLSARERVERRCLEQAAANQKLFVSVATLLHRYLVSGEAVPEEYRPAVEWLESEAKKRGSKSWWEYVE